MMTKIKHKKVIWQRVYKRKTRISKTLYSVERTKENGKSFVYYCNKGEYASETFLHSNAYM